METGPGRLRSNCSLGAQISLASAALVWEVGEGHEDPYLFYPLSTFYMPASQSQGSVSTYCFSPAEQPAANTLPLILAATP